MNRHHVAIGLFFVAGANIAEGAVVPYLLPDDHPTQVMGGQAVRTGVAMVHGSNYSLVATAIAGFSDDRWR